MYLQLRKVFTHNLKGFDLDIPLNKLIVITGPSGSGKSSLAFDTIAKLGKQRMLLVENCGTFFMDHSRVPAEISGAFPPVVAFSQGVRDWFPYKNVAEILGIMPLLEYLFVEYGELSCAKCGMLNRLNKVNQVLDWVNALPEGARFYVLAPIRDVSIKALDYFLSLGYTRFMIDDREVDLSEQEFRDELGSLFVILDRLVKDGNLKPRILDAISLSFSINRGKIVLRTVSGAEAVFNFDSYCLNCEESLIFGFKKCSLCRGLGFSDREPCPQCGGLKLASDILNSRLFDREIRDILTYPLAELISFISAHFSHLAQLRDILNELELSLLPVHKPVFRMSLGVRKLLELLLSLAIKMKGVLYIFDEPTLGLDESRRKGLLKIFRNLIDEGNSCIVVEHDPLFIKSADLVIELGPEGGERGGYLISVSKGSEYSKENYDVSLNLENLKERSPNSVTFILRGKEYRIYKGAINSLQFSLLEDEEDLLYEIMEHIQGQGLKVHLGDRISRNLRDRFLVDYMGIWEAWREVLKDMPDARIRGFNKRHFSFHTPEGVCKRCRGRGERDFELQDVSFKIPCEECYGKGLNPEILALTYRGYRIKDILEFSLKEALELLSQLPKIREILYLVREVKIDYLKLSQRLRELSGGELLRVNLIKILTESQGTEVLILTYPFQGLSIREIIDLTRFLKRISEKGLTIIIREPHPLAEKLSDWTINI